MVKTAKLLLAASLAPVSGSVPYDPVELLCSYGKNDDGSKHVQGWCKDWMACIKTKATPANSAEAVKKAWAPADCKEYCDVYPAQSFLQSHNAPSKSDKKHCLDSCASFQSSLSSCVATIMFEPGKVANMGMPEEDAPKGPEICTGKDTPCLPDLEIRAQRCILHKAKSKLSAAGRLQGKHEVPDECGMIEMHMDDCKECPQITQTTQTQYAAFVGGCIDQLNAYYQATHPTGGKAIPNETGCSVNA